MSWMCHPRADSHAIFAELLPRVRQLVEREFRNARASVSVLDPLGLVLDIDATVKGREPDYKLIADLAAVELLQGAHGELLAGPLGHALGGGQGLPHRTAPPMAKREQIVFRNPLLQFDNFRIQAIQTNTPASVLPENQRLSMFQLDRVLRP